MALLEVKDLEVYYGVIRALKGISFEVEKGEIVTLIGANGAGKTTTMQSVIGLIPARHGKVIFDGRDITKTPCHKIVHLGMSQVPEGRRVFQELTVYENLMMGAYSQKDNNSFKEDIDRIYERFPRLAERRNQITLSAWWNPRRMFFWLNGGWEQFRWKPKQLRGQILLKCTR